MTDDDGENGRRSAPRQTQGAGRKNAAALSAALRANLQRRKARERALRDQALCDLERAEDAASVQTSTHKDEAAWTK